MKALSPKAKDPLMDFSKNGRLGYLVPINEAKASEIARIAKAVTANSFLNSKNTMQAAIPT